MFEGRASGALVKTNSQYIDGRDVCGFKPRARGPSPAMCVGMLDSLSLRGGFMWLQQSRLSSTIKSRQK